MGKNFIHVSQGFYRFRFLLIIFLFYFFFFDKYVFTLSVTQTVFVGSETTKPNDFDQFWKFKFHFEHNFLLSRDPVIIRVYLRTTDIHFHDQGNVREPTSELLKCDLVQTLNTFRNTSMRIFAAGKASSC